MSSLFAKPPHRSGCCADAEVAAVSIGDQFWCDIRDEWLTIDEVFFSRSATGLRIAGIHAKSDDGRYGRSTIITIHTPRKWLRLCARCAA